jgi:hypothetical protein
MKWNYKVVYLPEEEEDVMRPRRSSLASMIVLGFLVGLVSGAAAAPEGQIAFAVHVSLAPAWFDPAERPTSSPRIPSH